MFHFRNRHLRRDWVKAKTRGICKIFRFPCVVFSIYIMVGLGFSPVQAVPDFLGTPETRAKNTTGKFQPCRNAVVGKFVGQERIPVLSEIKKMNFRNLRVLDGTAPVNYEFVPDRLTLVLSERGIVTRAFCR